MSEPHPEGSKGITGYLILGFFALIVGISILTLLFGGINVGVTGPVPKRVVPVAPVPSPAPSGEAK